MIAMARLSRSQREPCGTPALNMTRETSPLWRMCEAALRGIVLRMLPRTERILGTAASSVRGDRGAHRLGRRRWPTGGHFREVLDFSSHESGENPQAQDDKDEPEPQMRNVREDREEPVVGGPGVKNGKINGKAVWEQRAKGAVVLILYGRARLGDCHSGRDIAARRFRRGRAPRSPTASG